MEESLGAVPNGTPGVWFIHSAEDAENFLYKAHIIEEGDGQKRFQIEPTRHLSETLNKPESARVYCLKISSTDDQWYGMDPDRLGGIVIELHRIALLKRILDSCRAKDPDGLLLGKKPRRASESGSVMAKNNCCVFHRTGGSSTRPCDGHVAGLDELDSVSDEEQYIKRETDRLLRQPIRGNCLPKK
jgi:hypothetical protein